MRTFPVKLELRDSHEGWRLFVVPCHNIGWEPIAMTPPRGTPGGALGEFASALYKLTESDSDKSSWISLLYGRPKRPAQSVADGLREHISILRELKASQKLIDIAEQVLAEELQTNAKTECVVNPVWSLSCSRGTRSCDVNHEP